MVTAAKNQKSEEDKNNRNISSVYIYMEFLKKSYYPIWIYSWTCLL